MFDRAFADKFFSLWLGLFHNHALVFDWLPSRLLTYVFFRNLLEADVSFNLTAALSDVLVAEERRREGNIACL